MGVRHAFTVLLTIRSPFIFPGLRGGAVGVDKSALRDEHGPSGVPLLPGDQVKGLVRLALQHMPPAAMKELTVRHLLGPEHGANVLEEPERGFLRFGDFAATDITEASTITRIRIDEETGVVQDGHLQSIELVAPLGRGVTFRGDVFYYGDAADDVRLLLEKALRIVPYFGGARSAGFGEHAGDEANIVWQKAVPLIPADDGIEGEILDIEGKFDRPYLVAAERIADNLLLGSCVVPGGVLKGALAQMLERAGKDTRTAGTSYEQALSKLRLSHAYPIDDDGEAIGRSLPFSTMQHPGSGRLACALDVKQEGLIDGQCADFAPDWKDTDAIARRLGRPPADLAMHERGHAKIDPATGAAEDGALFVEVARGNYARRGGQRIKFTADFGDCGGNSRESKQALRDIRAMLSSALWDIGKTNADLRLEAKARKFGPDDLGAPPWRLLLETDGVLIDPETHADGATVEDQLRRYFEDIAPGASLRRSFVQRKLVGGYPAWRYRSGAYRPYSLFQAGSSFLIDAAGEQAAVAERLAVFVRHGLPVRVWNGGKMVPAVDWLTMPFLPQNGYGAISINDPIFARLENA